MVSDNETQPRALNKLSMVLGLGIVLVAVPILWWPHIANLWLPDDLVLRNLSAQGMDWAVAVTLVFIVLVFERRGLASFGFKRLNADTLYAGIGLGGFFMIGSIAFLFLCTSLGLASDASKPGAPSEAYPPYFFFWYAPLALVTAAVAEEIIFRGYALERLLKLRINPVVALILVQIAFALYHVKDGLFSVINVALVGSLFSIYYIRYRNLTMTIIAHGLVDSLAIVGRVFGVG